MIESEFTFRFKGDSLFFRLLPSAKKFFRISLMVSIEAEKQEYKMETILFKASASELKQSSSGSICRYKKI